MWSWLASIRTTASGVAMQSHGLPSDADPRLMMATSVADFITAISYFAIAISLVVLVHRLRGALPFGRVFLLFGAFIVLCGGTHLVVVIGLSASAPLLATAISVATAAVSLLTAVLVPIYIPKVQKFVRAVEAGREVDRAHARAAAVEEANVRLTEQARALEHLNAELAGSLERRIALEAQLRQAQKMEVLGRMAGGVAHDFNNLLAIIRGNLELAQDIGTFDPLLIEAHRDAAEAAESASTLTRRLLRFGRHADTRSALVSIDAQLRSDQRMFSSALPSGVQIGYQLESEPAEVIADSTELQQAVLNLLLNAADAMSECRGQVNVSTAVHEFNTETNDTVPPIGAGSYVALSVADEGTGMDAEVLSRVFEPFYTTKGEGKGTGLGLAMVYDTVERMRGGVSVNSTPGKGSTFTLWLPVATERWLVGSGRPVLA